VKLEHTTLIATSRERLWAFLMNVPEVSRCVPGVQDVKALDDKTYEGTLRVRVGPISLSLGGRIILDQQDAAAGVAIMTAQATDRKVGGGLSAKMQMTLVEKSPDEVELRILTDANVVGKLGEFGQPVIRKKADQMMGEFAENVKKQMAN